MKYNPDVYSSKNPYVYPSKNVEKNSNKTIGVLFTIVMFIPLFALSLINTVGLPSRLPDLNDFSFYEKRALKNNLVETASEGLTEYTKEKNNIKGNQNDHLSANDYNKLQEIKQKYVLMAKRSLEKSGLTKNEIEEFIAKNIKSPGSYVNN